MTLPCLSVRASCTRKYEETHFQKAYSLDEVKRAALEAGMEFVAAYDACTRNPVREDSERIYVIMREQGKTMRDEGVNHMADYVIRATAAQGQIRAFCRHHQGPGGTGQNIP